MTPDSARYRFRGANMRLAQYRYTLSVIFFLVTIAIPCVVYLQSKDYAALGLVGTFLGFFFFMTQDRIEHTARLEEVARFADAHGPAISLARAVVGGRASHTVRLNSTQASDYVMQRLKEARRMYNTSFTTSDSVLTARYKKWLRLIAQEVVQRDVIVEEVVGSRERLDFINENVGQSADDRKGEYTAYLLEMGDGELPYIETCIFENTDGQLEVLFGWSSNKDHYIGDDVFMSRDESLAKFYLSYFHRLARHGRRRGIAASSKFVSGERPKVVPGG